MEVETLKRRIKEILDNDGQEGWVISQKMNGVLQVTSVTRWTNDFSSYLLIEYPHLKICCEQHTGQNGFSVTIQSALICTDIVAFRTMLAFLCLLFVFTCVITAYTYNVISTFKPENSEAISNLFKAYSSMPNASASIFMPTSNIPSTARSFMQSSFHAQEL
jgi:hypothetical protein